MIAAYLGGFTFYWASPVEDLYQQDVESLQFPGTDGADFRLLGFHSREWRLETLADFFDGHSAYSEIELYRTLQELPPQQLVHYGINFDARGFRAKVMRIEPGNSRQRGGVKQHAALCGGRVTDTTVVAAATWTLKWTRT